MVAAAPPSAYAALRTAAVLVPRHDRLRMTFAGEKAKEALGGLVTNDIALLKPGVSQRSVALTPKGRVIAMIRVMDRGTDVLVDCEATAAEGFVAMVRKFVNPRLAKYAVVTDTTGCLGVYGPQAAEHLANVSHADVLTIPSDDLGVPGFDLIGERDTIEEIEAALMTRGLGEVDAETLEIAALEAGIPRFGIEMDGETIPQEANLDTLGAMAFNKGCYTGQEVVARIHFRGHVNRHLRRLRSDVPLARGDAVLDVEGKEVGDVRSAVVSPTLGPTAIAMIRREVEPGADVTVRRETGAVTARVEALA